MLLCIPGLVQAQGDPLQLIVKAGDNHVESVAISVDGRYLATGNPDGTARLWAIESGDELRRFVGHEGPITSITISSDSRFLVTGSRVEGIVRLWSFENGRELRRFDTGSMLESVAISPDNRYVAAASYEGGILWSVESGEVVRRSKKFRRRKTKASSVAFSSDNRYVVSGNEDGTVRLLSLEKWKEHLRFEAHMADVISVAISSDNRFMVTGSRDSTACVWALDNGVEIRFVLRHADELTSVAISPNGHYVATVSRSGGARLWSIESGEEVTLFSSGASMLANRVTSIAFSSNNRYVVTGEDDMARLWSLASGEEIRSFKGHSGVVNSVALTTDNRYIMTQLGDGIASIWSVEEGEEVRRILGELKAENLTSLKNYDSRYKVWVKPDNKVCLHEWEKEEDLCHFEWYANEVTSIAISADARYVLTGSNDSTAHLWSLDSGDELRRFEGHSDVVTSVAFSTDNHYVLTGSNDNTARLWMVEDGSNLGRFEGHSDNVTVVGISSDNRYVLTGSQDGTIRLWSLDNLEEVRSFGELTYEILFAGMSPDNRNVVAASSDGTFHVWSLENGDEMERLGPFGFVQSVAFSGGGHDIVIGQEDGSVLISRIDGEEEPRHFEGHSDVVKSLGVSSDGRYLITASSDRTARLWLIQSGDEVHRFENEHFEEVAITSDGRYILALSRDYYFPHRGEEDDNLRLWSTESGEEVRSFNINGSVRSMAISSDGRYVVTASSDEGVQLWSVNTGEELQRFEEYADFLTQVVISSDSRYLLISSFKTACLWILESGERKHCFEGHAGGITSVAFSSDEKYVLTGSYDHTSRIWSTETGEEMIKLVSFTDGTWAVIDPHGRFDASNGGDVPWLHFVKGNTPIALSQLKDRYYEPGLLAKVMGFNDEPLRDVEAFREADVALAPELALTAPSIGNTNLQVSLTNAGGGIGAVRVLINGKELLADARDPSTDFSDDSLKLSIPIASSDYLIPGQENEITVVAYNSEGSITSPETRVFYTPPAPEPVEAPSLWGIVMGVHDYAGDQLDLRYAAKDAADMARALEVSASRLLGTDKVDITLLSTDSLALSQGARAATKTNLEAAFAEIGDQAKAGDILVVYVSGHGVTYGGQDGDFYYLTKDAVSGTLSDEGYRSVAAVSSEELTELIKGVPALKQLLILDTCGSGRVVDRLAEVKDIPTSQIRALERMKDRTGMFVLAGSAADAVSYEATPYGQGLLTYSLLEGMRNPEVLREGSLLDVRSWFDYAERRVPELAQGLGGIQEPRQIGASSFDVGQVTDVDVDSLPGLKRVRPLFLKSNFQDESRLIDNLGLAQVVDNALYEKSSKGEEERVGYVSSETLEHAYKIGGRYRVENNLIHIRARVFQGGNEVLNEITLVDEVDALDEVVETLIENIEAFLDAL